MWDFSSQVFNICCTCIGAFGKPGRSVFYVYFSSEGNFI